MPVLEKIVVQDFRNIALQEVDFCHNVNCISGGNGEGKTNLLDAIWHLGMTKSAFSGSDRFNVRHSAEGFAIAGTFRMDDGTSRKYSVKVDRDGKKVKKGDRLYERISDHIGEIPVVMVSPADTSMVSDAAEERRRFANSSISQINKEYLSDLQQYNRILLQRNKMLRDGISDATLMDVFNTGLSDLASRIYERRREFRNELLERVQHYYEMISGGRESVGIEYRSDISKGDLKSQLEESLDRDLALKYTYSGIHRDDFLFTMDGHSIRKCGSQGQQKSFLVALKFAQYDVVKKACGIKPLLLLDDLFDKLDMERVSNLLKMVSGTDFGQIFITDSNKVRLRSVAEGLEQEIRYIEAEGGAFHDA